MCEDIYQSEARRSRQRLANLKRANREVHVMKRHTVTCDR
jgi:hypothetical protein